MISKRKIQPREMRAALELVPAKAGQAEDTMEVIWSTGYRDMRYDWGKDEMFYEELVMTPEACDLTRLNAGAPVLIQHHDSVMATIAVFERAWIEGGKGHGVIRFSKRPEFQGIIGDMKGGILRNLSVGYRVIQYTESIRAGEDIKTMLVTKWLPKEVSLVAIGFDPESQTKRSSETASDYEVEIIRNEETALEKTEDQTRNEETENKEKEAASETTENTTESEKTETEKSEKEDEKTDETATPGHKEKADQEAQRAAAEAAGRDRVLEVTRAVAAAKLPHEFAEELLKRNLTKEQVAEEIFKKLETKTADNPARKTEMNRQDQAAQALLNRIDAKRFSVEKENPFVGKTLMQTFEAIVARNAGESDSAYMKRAATATTDLPQLLANVANKAMQADGAQKFTYDKFAMQQTLKNYHQMPVIQLAGVSLAAKTETGDYVQATLVDTDEKIQLEERGIILALTPKAIANDDLGALKSLPSLAPKAGHRDLEKRMYALLTSNSGAGPVMSDTKNLFHEDHDNIVADVAPTPAGIAAVNTAMAAFMDEAGEDLGLRVKHVIVGTDYEFIAKQTASSKVVPGAANEVNPYAGEIEVHVSSRVPAKRWFAVCDGEEWRTLVYGTKEGMAAPSVETEVDFKSSALQTKIEFPNCVGVASYKGIIRCTGPA